MSVVVVPKYAKIGEGFSRREKSDSHIHPGRKTETRGYQSPATWITQMADGRKALLLCVECEKMFNAAKNRYRIRYIKDPTGATRGMRASGACDGCKQETANMGGGYMWVSEETWSQVSQDPEEAKIKWRRAWRT